MSNPGAGRLLPEICAAGYALLPPVYADSGPERPHPGSRADQMGASIVLLGTFETKAEELLELESALIAEGLEVTRMDLSLESGGSSMPADAKLARMRDRAENAAKAVSKDMPAAVIGVGGGTGSEMVLQAMQPLPLDLPKFLVTTLPFDPRGNVADCPVTLIPSPCDIQGVNSTLRQLFARTAAMVASVVDERIRRIGRHKGIAVSLLGVTQAAGARAIRLLRAAGHETSTFHASGFGGAALVRFAREGMFEGMIDLTVNEIVRMHVAGSHTPMPERFTCGGDLPRIVVPGALNFLDAGSPGTLRRSWRARAHYCHSSHFTHVKLNEREIVRAARALATDLNCSRAHCEILLPMGGFSSEDRPGGAIEDPGLRECAAEVFEKEATAFEVTRMPDHINSPEVATRAVARLLARLPSGDSKP